MLKMVICSYRQTLSPQMGDIYCSTHTHSDENINFVQKAIQLVINWPHDEMTSVNEWWTPFDTIDAKHKRRKTKDKFINLLDDCKEKGRCAMLLSNYPKAYSRERKEEKIVFTINKKLLLLSVCRLAYSQNKVPFTAPSSPAWNLKRRVAVFNFHNSLLGWEFAT